MSAWPAMAQTVREIDAQRLELEVTVGDEIQRGVVDTRNGDTLMDSCTAIAMQFHDDAARNAALPALVHVADPNDFFRLRSPNGHFAAESNGHYAEASKPSPSTAADEAPRVRIYTIAEARQRIQQTIEHLPLLGYDGYFVRGWTHLLAGWWRLGKTELMAAIVAPWLRLGMHVVWITEEPDSIWADRADAFDEIYAPVPWERLQLVDALSEQPPELLNAVCSLVADVVIADTIREVCGIASMKDDDAVYRAVSPWIRRLRDGRRTLIFLSQHRKQAGERGERVEGSVALPSKMDIVLELEAVEGKERQRRLTVRQRRSQTSPLLLEMDDDERITVVPDGRQRGRVETEDAVLAVVAASAEPLSSTEVRSRMNPRPSRPTVKRALTSLATAGRIRRDPPISEPAERRTVRWAPAATQAVMNLAHERQPIYRQFAEPDDCEPDFAGSKITSQPGADAPPDDVDAPLDEPDPPGPENDELLEVAP